MSVLRDQNEIEARVPELDPAVLRALVDVGDPFTGRDRAVARDVRMAVAEWIEELIPLWREGTASQVAVASVAQYVRLGRVPK